MVAMVAAVIMTVVLVECSPWKRAMPTETIYFSVVVVTISAQRNSFQDLWRTRKANAASAGRANRFQLVSLSVIAAISAFWKRARSRS